MIHRGPFLETTPRWARRAVVQERRASFVSFRGVGTEFIFICVFMHFTGWSQLVALPVIVRSFTGPLTLDKMAVILLSSVSRLKRKEKRIACAYINSKGKHIYFATEILT